MTFYKAALGITQNIPSEETLRHRIGVRQELLEKNVAVLRANGIQPSALSNGLVPVDIDVNSIDDSKIKYARKLILGLGRSNAWRHVFIDSCEAIYKGYMNPFAVTTRMGRIVAPK